MRILLDECLPRELAVELAGHEVSTVQQMGWGGLQNGELLEKASRRFEIFLTIDQQIERQHTIPLDIAVITIRARSNRIQDIRPLVPALLQALTEAKTGKSTVVGRVKRR
ncbi:MAG: DUF5615 family PIN-like protein [Acidobacteria bacterium]|nr:DUF5615 family PIN-like protein [Acidobacteriota bacterium]